MLYVCNIHNTLHNESSQYTVCLSILLFGLLVFIISIISGGLRGDHSEAATRMEAAIAEAARREELPFLRE